MARVYAVTNQKGGVGKTTTAVNLAAALALKNRRVLLLDLDPQGNTSAGSGLQRDDPVRQRGSCELLLAETPARELIVQSAAGGYALLPTDSSLTAAEVELLQREDRRLRLKNRLEPLQAEYDYALIDCPPALNILTVNAMMAADGLIVPVQCEYYALEGLSALMETMQQLQMHNPRLCIFGILRTLYSRNRLADEVSGELRAHFGARLFDTVIPRNVRLAEAPGYGLPVSVHDPDCSGARAYQQLAEEVLERAERNVAAAPPSSPPAPEVAPEASVSPAPPPPSSPSSPSTPSTPPVASAAPAPESGETQPDA